MAAIDDARTILHAANQADTPPTTDAERIGLVAAGALVGIGYALLAIHDELREIAGALESGERRP